MSSTARRTWRILPAVTVAAVASIVGGCATTWLVWFSGLAYGASGLGLMPLPAMMLIYVLLAALLLRSNDHTVAMRSIAAAVGLVASLIVGGVVSEVIHCSFDRAGCINL